MAIMNTISLASFFNKTYIVTFDHHLVAGSIKGGLFNSVSTYLGTVKTNTKDILHLYYLV